MNFYLFPCWSIEEETLHGEPCMMIYRKWLWFKVFEERCHTLESAIRRLDEIEKYG